MPTPSTLEIKIKLKKGRILTKIERMLLMRLLDRLEELEKELHELKVARCNW